MQYYYILKKHIIANIITSFKSLHNHIIIIFTIVIYFLSPNYKLFNYKKIRVLFILFSGFDQLIS